MAKTVLRGNYIFNILTRKQEKLKLMRLLIREARNYQSKVKENGDKKFRKITATF